MTTPLPITAGAVLFTVRGAVEARRVLRPTSLGPRLEVSFSAALASEHLGPGGSAFTFIAQPVPGGEYRWVGRGLLLLGPGAVSLRGEGTGHRSEGFIRYAGRLRMKPQAPAHAWLADLPLDFDYEQDLQSLQVLLTARAAQAR